MATALLLASTVSCAQNIYYTGRLFGYYRIENGQTQDQYLGPVKEFIGRQKNVKPGLWLGMGDNFGPEFGSGIQPGSGHDPCVKLDGDQPTEYPKKLYKSEYRYATSASCDNVANFLMTAGYRAIVPGREDFIYTSYWLANIAVMLRDASRPNNPNTNTNPDKKLTLLAANLRLVPGKNDSSQSKNSTCPLLFANPPFDGTATSCTSDKKTPSTFDWVERLDKIIDDQNNCGNSQQTKDQCTPESPSKIEKENPTRLAIQRALESPSESVRTTLVKNQLLILLAAWGAVCDLKQLDAKDLSNLNDWKDVITLEKKIAAYQHEDDPQTDSACVNAQNNGLNDYWRDFKPRLQAAIQEKAGKDEFNNLLISSTAARSDRGNAAPVPAADQQYTVVHRLYGEG
jgi:hypothetical protein